MWPDNETEKDFLNFSGVAGTVAEIITQATGRPTSIGISGSWGAGKSSMIKLVRAALAEKGGQAALEQPVGNCALTFQKLGRLVRRSTCSVRYVRALADEPKQAARICGGSAARLQHHQLVFGRAVEPGIARST